MNLIYQRLKTLIPQLNKDVITPEMLFEILERHKIECFERPLKKKGYFVHERFIFIKYGLTQILTHEVLAHEAVHALAGTAVDSIKQELEAEAMALICMIPATKILEMILIADSLDKNEYELLKRRIKIQNKYEL